MIAVRHAVAVSAAVALTAGAAPTLAATESYHESRQDHLIQVLESDVAAVRVSVTTVTKSVTSLGGQVVALDSAVASLAAQAVPEYGVANVAIAQGGSTTGTSLPPLTSPQVPRDGGNGAVVSGTTVVTCTTAPCAIFMRAGIHSNRPAPASGKSPGEIGGGIDVSNASTGALVAAANIENDGKHGATGLFNIDQVPLVSLNVNLGTIVPFDSPSAILNGGATIDSQGGVDVPAGQYLVHGSFLFYDLDNASTTASAGAARDRVARAQASMTR